MCVLGSVYTGVRIHLRTLTLRLSHYVPFLLLAPLRPLRARSCSVCSMTRASVGALLIACACAIDFSLAGVGSRGSVGSGAHKHSGITSSGLYGRLYLAPLLDEVLILDKGDMIAIFADKLNLDTL